MQILLSSHFKNRLSALCLILTLTLSVSAQSFECNTELYQVVNGNELKLLIPSTGVYETVGISPINYNGAGFNSEDNFIYGIGSGTVLVRIDNTGQPTNLGAISGFTAISYSGDFDLNGNWYSFKKTGSSWLMNKIDVSTAPPTAEEFTVTELSGVADASTTNDIAYNAISNKFYGMNGGYIMEFDPFNKTIKNIADYSNEADSGGYGAVWSDETGSTYFFNNTTGNIYRAVVNSLGEIASFAFISTSAPNGNNDGMSCPSAKAPVFPEICDNGIDDDNDGLTDCEDPDCTSSQKCGISGEIYSSTFGCKESIVSYHTFFTNNSSLPNTVTVTEQLPQGFVFLQDTVEFDGGGYSDFSLRPEEGDQGMIKWGALTLQGGETVRISYDVILSIEATNGIQANQINVQLERAGTTFTPSTMTSDVLVGVCPTPKTYNCEPAFYQVYKKKGKNQPNVYGRLNPITGDYDAIAIASDLANGLGYDINSGLIYGASGKRFIQLDNDGLVIDQGITFNKNVFRGDMNQNSEWYGVVGNDMVKIDVSNSPVITGTYINQGLPGWDLAYNQDGHFYSIHEKSLYQFNTTTNTKTFIGVLNGTNIPNNGGYGAQWTGSDGHLYASHNQSGMILRIDVTTAVARIVSQSVDGLSQNDGFSCPSSIPVVFEFDYGDNSRLPQSRILSYKQDLQKDDLPDFSTFWLGNTVNYDNTDPSNTRADGDVDDGFTLSTQIDNGTLSGIIGLNSNISGRAYYIIGLDWDDDGSFDEVLKFDSNLSGATTVIQTINTPTGYVGGFINARVIISEVPLDANQISGDILELGEVEDYRYEILAPCSGPDCSVSTGTSGGLESNGDLATAIAKRNYNRVKTNYNKHLKANQQKLIEVKASGITRGNNLNKYFPEVGATGNEEVTVSTPEDLIEITNANDVFAVDYYLNSQRVAASLLLSTDEEVYNHSKNVCDRLNGKSVEDVQVIHIEGMRIIFAKIKHETKGIEYSAWFSAKEQDDKYEVFSYWNVDAYPTGQYLNFQVWSSSPNQVFYLLEHILKQLQSTKRLVSNHDVAPLPKVIVKSGKYENGALVISLINKSRALSATFDINLRRTELSDYIKETYQVNINGTSEEEVIIPTGFLFDAGIALRVEDSEVYDALYLADGAWGVDFNQSLGEIETFSTLEVDEPGNENEYLVERGFQASGYSTDVINVFRNLKAGTKTVTMENFSTLSFDIQNNHPIEVILVENGLKDWENRLSVEVPIHSEMDKVTLKLSDFYDNDQHSILDLQTVVFSYVNKSGSSEYFKFGVGNLVFGNETILSLNIPSNDTSNFMIYPNPATDLLRIKVISQGGILTIANLKGQVLLEKMVNGSDFENGIPLSIIPGLYIVTYNDNKGYNTQLLQVE